MKLVDFKVCEKAVRGETRWRSEVPGYSDDTREKKQFEGEKLECRNGISARQSFSGRETQAKKKRWRVRVSQRERKKIFRAVFVGIAERFLLSSVVGFFFFDENKRRRSRPPPIYSGVVIALARCVTTREPSGASRKEFFFIVRRERDADKSVAKVSFGVLMSF